MAAEEARGGGFDAELVLGREEGFDTDAWKSGKATCQRIKDSLSIKKLRILQLIGP